MTATSDAHLPSPQNLEPGTDEPEPSDMTPEQRLWWNEPREVAYQSLAQGEALREVVTQAGITPRTLWNWRHHPFWQTRAAKDRQLRAKAIEEQLLGTDAAALEAIRAHVGRSATVGLRYLQLRKMLGTPPADDSSVGTTFLMDEEVQVLDALDEGRVVVLQPGHTLDAEDAVVSGTLLPSPGDPIRKGRPGRAIPVSIRATAPLPEAPDSVGTACPELAEEPALSLPNGEVPAPAAPPYDPHTPYPNPHQPPWKRKLMEAANLANAND